MKKILKRILPAVMAVALVLTSGLPYPITAKADEQDNVDLVIEKFWENDTESSRPESVTMNVLCDGSVYDEAVVTKDGGWKTKISVPRMDDNGHEYDWDIDETVPDGYESSVSRTFVRDGIPDVPEEKTYTVTWYDEDGSTILDGPVEFTDGETEPVTDVVPVKTSTDDYTFRFTGWERSVDDNGNISYTAAYEEVAVTKYTVTYKDGKNGAVFADRVFEDLNTGDPMPEFGTVPECDGYTFTGWNPVPTEKVGSSDAVYTAVWQKNPEKTITVTWTDRGTVIKTITVNADKDYSHEVPVVPNRDGYRFVGWGNPILDQNGNVTFEAHWEEEVPQVYEFTVKYHGNGASQGIPETFYISGEEDEVTINIPSTIPVYPGYTFMGWSENMDATTGIYQPGGVIILGSLFPGHVEKTLYAVWKETYAEGYDIEFDANGGTNAPLPIRDQEYDSPYWVPKTGPVRDGYELTGWATSADAMEPEYYYTGDPYIDEFASTTHAVFRMSKPATPLTGPVVLYAVWKEKLVDVTFTADDMVFTSDVYHNWAGYQNYTIRMQNVSGRRLYGPSVTATISNANPGSFDKLTVSGLKVMWTNHNGTSTSNMTSVSSHTETFNDTSYPSAVDVLVNAGTRESTFNDNEIITITFKVTFKKTSGLDRPYLKGSAVWKMNNKPYDEVNPYEVIYLTDTQSQAESIATSLGLTLKNFSYGVATYETDQPLSYLNSRAKTLGYSEFERNGSSQLTSVAYNVEEADMIYAAVEEDMEEGAAFLSKDGKITEIRFTVTNTKTGLGTPDDPDNPDDPDVDLIKKVPAVDDLDAMSDWFAEVKAWAEKNGYDEIADKANSGLFYGSNEKQVARYRRTVLSLMKALTTSDSATRESLINDVPDTNDLDAMSDWFAMTKAWAQKNGYDEIVRNAGNGLFYGNDKNQVSRYGRTVLSLLKALDISDVPDDPNDPDDEEMTVFTVKAVWNDQDDKDGLRPDILHAVLMQNGKTYGEPVEISGDNWNAELPECPVKDEAGNTYTYGVDIMDMPEGYDSDILLSDKTFEITLTHTPVPSIVMPEEKDTIKVTVSCKDEMPKEGVNVTILKDGKEFKTVTINDSSDWMNLVAGLETGHEYSIKVDAPEGYRCEVKAEQSDNGIIFDITMEQVKEDEVEVTVKAVWDDNDDKDGLRPKTVSVNILEGADPVVLSGTDNWAYRTYSDKEYDVDYIDITTVPDGYSAHVESEYDHKTLKVVIALKHDPAESGDLGLSIVWNDGDNADGLRPDSVKGTLLQDNESYKDITMTAADGWKQVLKDIPKTDALGNMYSYMLNIAEEDIPAGYDMSIRNTTVTFTHVPEKQTSMTAQIVWTDNNNADGIRPEYVDVELLTDGKVSDTGRADKTNFWACTFNKLEAGHEYVVRLKNEVEGYTADVKGSVITLTHTVSEDPEKPETTDFTIKAEWKDDNNKDGMRPDSTKVSVLKNDEAFADITLDKANGWKHDYTGLPVKDENGEKIEYSISVTAPDGYEAVVNGFNILFTRKATEKPDNPEKPDKPGLIETPGKPGMLTATVTINWIDGNDKAGARPDKLTATIRRNGEDFRSITLDKEHGWKISQDDLPATDDNGVNYRYSVKMPVPKGYKGSVDGFDFTMTYKDTSEKPGEDDPDVDEPDDDKPGEDKPSANKTVDVTLSVTWNDSDDKYDMRPDSMEATVLQNGKDFRKVTLKKSDGWKYTCKDLPSADDNGKTYKYTAKVYDSCEGYKASVDGTKITMKYESTKFTVTAVWADSNDKADKRPDSTKVKVYRNDKFYKDVTLTKEDGWKTTLDLPKYDSDGKEYEYTVKADDVPEGYEVSIKDGKITYTLKGTSSNTNKDSDKTSGKTTTTGTKTSTSVKPGKGNSSDSGEGKGEAVKTGQETYVLMAVIGITALSGGAYLLFRKRRTQK